MPEAPDLEAYAAYVRRHLLGRRATEARALVPPVVKSGREHLSGLVGRALVDASRRGKHLRLDFEGGPVLLVHPMLAGRFCHLPHEAPLRPRTALVIAFDDGADLRLRDDKLLSRVYVFPDGAQAEQALAPRPDQGPDALDPDLSPDVLLARLRGQRGRLKALITGERLVSGIGNAYADEVLFEAGISPLRPADRVSAEEASRLLEAMRRVLVEATAIVLARMEREGLPDEEYRDHLRVHRRGGQPCPRCGTAIAEVVSGGRVTSYCPRCQP